MGQALLKLTVVGLVVFGVGFVYLAYKSSSDPCELAKLQTSQIEITKKDRGGLKLHLDYGFGTKLKKYLRHVEKVQSTVFHKERWKSRPAMVSLATHFKSKKSAKSAHRYLKKKWESKKKSAHEVVLDDKTVIWYRNSYATNQCFYQAVTLSKENLGLDTSKEVQVAKAKKPTKRTKKVAKK